MIISLRNTKHSQIGMLKSCLLLLIVLGNLSNQTSAALDQTNIGVNNGDSFEYTVIEFNYSETTYNGFYLIEDQAAGQTIRVKQGEAFKIVFNDIELRPPRTHWNDFKINYDIHFKNKVIPTFQSLDQSVSGFVICRDWAGHRERIHSDFENSKLEYNLENFEGMIIDTRYEFGVKKSFTMPWDRYPDDPYDLQHFWYEDRYDKQIGMLTFSYYHVISFVGEKIIELEYKIIQKGFRIPLITVPELYFLQVLIVVWFLVFIFGNRRLTYRLSLKRK